MADTYYTVKKGDTLTSIALKFNTTVTKLVELNHLTNPNYIVVGQVLRVTGNPTKEPVNTTSIPTIRYFGLQSNTDRTVYATWLWSKANTEHYITRWYYDTGDGIWFIGNDSTTTTKQSLYTAPGNAKRVRFLVKPVSQKHTVNKKEVVYWTAGWSTEKIYDFSQNPPVTPPVPTVKIVKYALTVELSNLGELNATHIQFQIVRDDTTIFNTGTAMIKTNAASYSCTVDAGSEYKVRCRSYRGNSYSEWSEYSSNISTMPSTPSGITECKALSLTSVYLEWPAVKTATTYDIEYATEKRYLDGSNMSTVINGIETTHYEVGGLETGLEYFFRVRGVSNNEKSGWSDIASVVIGKNPSSPTTWSSTTTAITGDPLILYWVHNSEDGSSQTFAELELDVDGFKTSYTIPNSVEEDEKDKVSSYAVDTSEYVEGTKIKWRVRTAGITRVYGDWSIVRTIDVYAPPTLELNITDHNGNPLSTLERFPFYINGLAGPNTQTPIGYNLSVISTQFYETVDEVGNNKIVNEGESVYSKQFDTSEALDVTLSASDINLENNITYKIVCVVSMNSGLTAESSLEFNVAWTDLQYDPDLEIIIDETNYSALLRPYCQNELGQLIDGVTLSVYRREFDGGFTELATGLVNTRNTYVIDPHPALDYARYRVVAVTDDTGAISYYDVPGYPVGGTSVIIQWDEEWSTFESLNEDEIAENAWGGSLLKLPYNVDISDSSSPDVSLVKYIGRSHPVSYYGTQKGSTSNWSMDIAKDDEETLYSLRRLSNWMGNVYVREPSGSGYWANIKVSFSQKHLDVTIPVKLTITRVEGGA